MPRKVKFFKQDTLIVIVIKCLLRHDSQIVLEKNQKNQGHSSALKINNEIQALSRISKPAGYPDYIYYICFYPFTYKVNQSINNEAVSVKICSPSPSNEVQVLFS